MEEFKFIVRKPLRHADRDGLYQTVAIAAKYPTYAYYYNVSGDVEGTMKNAIAELKMKLIADIVNAKFEVEND